MTNQTKTQELQHTRQHKTNFPDRKIIQPFVHLTAQLFPQE